MGLALDEPTENDEKYEEGKLTFLIEKKLAGSFPGIIIEYQDSWFGKGFVVNMTGAGRGC